MSFVLPGVKILELKKNVDERGFFAELMRGDWKDFFEKEGVVQTNVSWSYPGVIRAWHRHARGQTDYMIVLKGVMRICAYDEASKGLDEVVSSSEKLQCVRIPGHYWHGVKVVGDEPALLVYFTTRLYDYSKPDEERRPENDPTIIDPRTGKPFDWNRPPHG